MKKLALVIIGLVFILPEILAQEASKAETKPPKLSKLEIEKIQADGYAYAEANCRFELSKMKLANDKDNETLLNEMNKNISLTYEVMEGKQEKYSESSLYTIFMNANNEAQGKLKVCIRSSKLKEQSKLEKNPKK